MSFCLVICLSNQPGFWADASVTHFEFEDAIGIQAGTLCLQKNQREVLVAIERYDKRKSNRFE